MSYFFGSDESSAEFPIPVASILPDYHLRNPLKIPTWLDKKTGLPSRIRHDKNYILTKGWKNVGWGNPFDLNRDYVSQIPPAPTVAYSNALSDLLMRVSIDNEIIPKDSRCDIRSIMSNLESLEMRYWSGMRYWGKVMIVMNALSSNRSPPADTIIEDKVGFFPLIGGKLIVLKTCIIISLDGRHWKIYDGDWVRLASDVNTQRFLLMVSSKIGRSLNPSHYPDVSILYQIFDWGDDVLSDHGNEGFKLLKAYEAIIIGVLQSRGEGSLVDPSRFLRNTLRDLLEENPSFLTHAKKLIGIIDRLESFHHISQAYGFHRVWGHPTVDSGKGMEKLRLIGRKDIIKDDSLSKDAGRMFKRLFAKEYMRKYGHYPKIREGSFTVLETQLLNNDPAATSVATHLLEEWDRITFIKTFDLPESFNLSMIVADKAISPSRSELIKSIKTKRTVMDPDKRRGVKRWLEDTTLKPKVFLREINDGIFDDDNKIIGLTPKERELNPTPRMFSLMSHPLRVYVVVTEQMLSDHILKMFPQITMTDSLLDLTKKMYATVKNQSSQVKRRNKAGQWVSRVVCMSLDFEKWNGHMRKDMTVGVFSSLGSLFGLPELFNRTYDLFEECYYYLADGSYLPKIDDNDLRVENPFSFTGHKGGMEGLRQKGWTIYTVCCLEVILSKYDCSYKIMGMGDNQVLQITVYSKKVDYAGQATEGGITEMKRLIGTIFEDLVFSFTQAGLPLKPLETWMSEDLYLYGKVPMWKGVPLTMDMKKLMRTFALSNEDIMTIENALGTVSSNSTAATQASPCIWTAYCIAILMSSLCIQDFERYHPLLGEGMGTLGCTTDKWVLAMSREEKHTFDIRHDGINREHMRLLFQIVPKSLGGYNGINLYELMMRGFPDNASRDICYLSKIEAVKGIPSWLRVCIRCWLTPVYMPSINYCTLLEDVTALNLMSPRSPTSGIRQLVSKYMSSGVNITNDEFKELMNSKYKAMSDYLSECLCEGKTLHIRLLHDIYEATIFGYVDSILSKVVKTSTIQKLAINDSDGSVFKSIYRDEINYYQFFRWRSVEQRGEFSRMCPTDRCKEIRLVGWRKELRGVTTPYPASYMTKTSCGREGLCRCDDGYISVHLPDGQMDNGTWNFDIGGNPPYLGSTTKEKVIVGSGGKIYSGEPLVRRPINLLKTINWFVPPTSNTAAVIRQCVSAVTDLDPNPYQGISEGTAGSEVHRYRDSSTTHGALTSSNFLYSTRYHISTDNFIRYSKGSENTDVHYQALFCYVLELTNMMISNDLRTFNPVHRFDHYRQECYSCINPIPEDFRDLTSIKALDAIPTRQTNPYLFVSKEKIRVMERISPLSDLSSSVFTAEDYSRMTGAAKLVWLQDVICDRIISDIVHGSGGETHVSVGLLDVKSYERTMYLKFSPSYMLKRVIVQLRRLSKWKCREHRVSTQLLGESDIIRTATNIITSSDDHAFMGIAMFYCWEETAKLVNVFPEMISPSSNPISITTACAAMRSNILSLISTRRWVMPRRCNIVADDEKYSALVYKMILSEFVDRNFRCEECVLLCDLMNPRNLDWEINHGTCRGGHVFKDRMKSYPWTRSNVTVERLRKDCTPGINLDRRAEAVLPSIVRSRAVKLASSSGMRIRSTVTGYQISGEVDKFNTQTRLTKYSLLTMKSLPTVTWYKCTDVYSIIKKELLGGSVFCVGDGLGSSSVVLTSLGAERVITSTILQPDEAIPQTFVHNVSPMIIEHKTSKINSSLMIDKTNNILDKQWARDWLKDLEGTDILVSDVEVISLGADAERHQIFETLISLKAWKLAIVKDYLYTPADMSNRIGFLNCTVMSWKLYTSKYRSSFYPEVWWIIRESHPKNAGLARSSPDWRNCRQLWDNVKGELEDRYDDDEIDEYLLQEIQLMAPIDSKKQMTTHLRSWMVFPVVGSMLPENGSFTKIFLYLRRSKLPAGVKMQRENKGLRLYDSDYQKLRSRIFAMAVAMISDINVRHKMINDSESWHLDWTEKKSGSWWCRLVYNSQIKDCKCTVIDYIPILSMWMRTQSLIFESIRPPVEFKPQHRKRDAVFFPISKTAASQ